MKWQPSIPYQGHPSAHSRPIQTPPGPPPLPSNHSRHGNSAHPSMYRPGFGQTRPIHGVPPPLSRGQGYYNHSRYYNYHHNNTSFSSPLPLHPQYASPAMANRHLIEGSPNSSTASPTSDHQALASPSNDSLKAGGCTCKKSRYVPYRFLSHTSSLYYFHCFSSFGLTVGV